MGGVERPGIGEHTSRSRPVVIPPPGILPGVLYGATSPDVVIRPIALIQSLSDIVKP